MKNINVFKKIAFLNWGGQHINFDPIKRKKGKSKITPSAGYNYALGVIPTPYVGLDVEGKKRNYGFNLHPLGGGLSLSLKGKQNNKNIKGSGGPRSLWKALSGGKSTD